MQMSTREAGDLIIIDISDEIDFANSSPFRASLSPEIQQFPKCRVRLGATRRGSLL
jgi:hypothetical protein